MGQLIAQLSNNGLSGNAGNRNCNDGNNKTGKGNNTSNNCNTGGSSGSGNNGSSTNTGAGGKNNPACKLSITPAQALVITAILGGTLQVDSVLVDRNQGVEIVLVGSLKQHIQKPKTELEKILDQIGSKPFDEVAKAMLGRLLQG